MVSLEFYVGILIIIELGNLRSSYYLGIILIFYLENLSYLAFLSRVELGFLFLI